MREDVINRCLTYVFVIIMAAFLTKSQWGDSMADIVAENSTEQFVIVDADALQYVSLTFANVTDGNMEMNIASMGYSIATNDSVTFNIRTDIAEPALYLYDREKGQVFCLDESNKYAFDSGEYEIKYFFPKCKIGIKKI